MTVATRKRRRHRRTRAPVLAVLGDTVDQFVAKTNTSRATAFRMMADGRLRYVKLGPRLRRIPTSEYARLGLVEADNGGEF
jgi:excisionase family DNA binding protein